MVFKLTNDPKNVGSYYQAILAFIFVIVSWPLMLLRLFIRGYLLKSFDKDDYTALLGQVSSR
jgi:hypothetical protein